MMAKAKRVLLVEISDIVIAGIVPIVESTGEFNAYYLFKFSFFK